MYRVGVIYRRDGHYQHAIHKIRSRSTHSSSSSSSSSSAHFHRMYSVQRIFDSVFIVPLLYSSQLGVSINIGRLLLPTGLWSLLCRQSSDTTLCPDQLMVDLWCHFPLVPIRSVCHFPVDLAIAMSCNVPQ